ncbi:F-box/kelch-repeat protein At3g06240-like [Corylus avellana]|uniref:F-box/kelch-repeat protein At3g06240-like n=1 Tax=Corylus avellana TaxID=13451 RepID=UPI00286AFDF5|nr:F-box/kelch-repeat protein At3g06240-like [Corylus avellana]
MAGSPPVGRMKQTTTPPAAFLSKQASGLLLFRSSSFVGKKKQTMSDCLPKEVITDILSRLPVKSLMRFRCVSKAWCSLISTPNFISTHLNRSLSNSPHQPYLFVCHCWTLHTVLLYPSDPEIEQKGDFFANPSDRIELRDPSNNEYSLHLVGSSNGLLCLATLNFDNEVGLCVLWNPSIQKAIYLPKPNLGFDRSLNKSFGFGYEPTTDDYKLVRLVYPDTDYIGFKTVPPLSTGPHTLHGVVASFAM